MVDDDVLTFNPPKLTHPLPERLMEMRISARRGVRKITYPVYLPRVLRPGGDGRSEQPPNRHAGEKLDAPASPHANPRSTEPDYQTADPSAKAIAASQSDE